VIARGLQLVERQPITETLKLPNLLRGTP
jgi:hypothetical protein